MFRYILRYYIDPGYDENKRIQELLEMCRCGKIEEVMFFYNPEELFQGYPSRKEEDAWFAVARKLKCLLDENGIIMSINPWITLGHLSRGRRFGENQKSFQPMVGETGIVSEITVCPFDSGWQNHIGSLFGRFAAELSPSAIWIEDDWRLHNHEASMGFGGCFCSLHLARFEKESGIRTNREELLQNILAPGKPHPWRPIWLKVSRDSLIEPAEKLYSAVNTANPAVRLGLMCSDPEVHNIEWRDWNRLKKAISPDGPLLLRPHMAPYTEQYALTCPPIVARQTIAEFDEVPEIYPELENSPRCGRYSKSAAFNIYECLHAALAGSNGITINHYDMMGTGLALDVNFPQELAAAKPFLNSLAGLGLGEWKSEGVNVLFSPENAAYVNSSGKNSMFEIGDNTIGWAKVFALLGISYTPVRRIVPGEIHAVSGQTIRSLSDHELQQLCSGKLILDACAAEIMTERGFGQEIGIAKMEWRSLEQDAYAYEEIPDGRADNYGLDVPRMSAQRCADRVLNITMQERSIEKSTIFRYNRSRLYPGSLYTENAMGGRVFIIAYPLATAQFEVGYYNNYRRIFMQTILKKLGTENRWLAGEEEPLHVYRYSRNAMTLLAFVNPTHDPLTRIRFTAPELSVKNAEMLLTDGRWENIQIMEDGGSFVCPQTVSPLSALILRLEINSRKSS